MMRQAGVKPARLAVLLVQHREQVGGLRVQLQRSVPACLILLAQVLMRWWPRRSHGPAPPASNAAAWACPVRSVDPTGYERQCDHGGLENGLIGMLSSWWGVMLGNIAQVMGIRDCLSPAGPELRILRRLRGRLRAECPVHLDLGGPRPTPRDETWPENWRCVRMD